MTAQYQQQNIDSGINMKLESLSACMDGELSTPDRDQLLGQLKLDADLQTEWSVFHCIGDVLRSDELACQRDGFNARFATLLQVEPHIFAPQAAQANAGAARHPRWLKTASLAASFAAIAVVAGVAMQQWSGRGADIAKVDPAAAPQVADGTPASQVTVPSAYLAAHRQYASQRAALYIQTVAHDSGK